MSSRYDRQLSLCEIGQEGQLRIRQASVVVVGAGGMGCPVLQYLAAAGIGRLGIVDSDIVEESNLQRQVIFGVQSLGKAKAHVAGDYIKNLNPDVQTELYPFRLTNENASIVLNPYDLTIDCSDNFETRYLINDFCSILNKPWIYGAIHRYEGQISVFNCLGAPSYRDIFPHQSLDEIPNCENTGVLGVLPGITGILQATECLKLVTGIGSALAGQMLVFNLLTQQYFRYCLKEVPREIPSKINFISPKELKGHRERYVLIDVRELNETQTIHHAHVHRIPLSELFLRQSEIPLGAEVVLICQSGYRSQLAAEVLAKTNRFSRVYSVQGGVVEYEAE